MTQKRLDNISEGIDFKGYKIKHRYYYDNEKNFIIFEDDKGNVQYNTLLKSKLQIYPHY